MKKRFKKYISKGIVSPLEGVQFHGKAPLKRILMLEKDKIKQNGVKIAVHILDKLPKKIPKYCELHKHEYDEINLILSEGEKLVYKVTLEDETYEVTSPSTIFIPAGVRHSAEVISGKGIMVAIIFMGKYKALK